MSWSGVRAGTYGLGDVAGPLGQLEESHVYQFRVVEFRNQHALHLAEGEDLLSAGSGEGVGLPEVDGSTAAIWGRESLGLTADVPLLHLGPEFSDHLNYIINKI